MHGAGDLLRQQPAGEHLFRPGREVLTQDRAPAGSPGEWTADGVACPALAVSTESIRALAVLPDAAGRDAERRKEESCCSSAMTGPRATITWSRRMMQARPWPGGGRRKGRPGSPGSTRWSRPAWERTPSRTRRGSSWSSRLTAARGLGRWPRPGTGSTRPTRGRRPGTRRRSRTRGRRTTSSTPAAWRTWPDPPAPDARARRRQRRAEAVKIAARAHQKLVWERTRHLLRTRSALREYFPAALEADRRPDPGRQGRPRTAGEGTGPGISRKADRYADHGRAQAGRAARRPGAAGAGHPGRAARPAPGPAGRSRRGARRVSTGRGRRDNRPQRAGKNHGSQGEQAFTTPPDAGLYLSSPASGITEQGPSAGRRRPAAIRRRRPARTTPEPPRRPSSPGKKKPVTPGTSATSTSSTPCPPRRCPRSACPRCPRLLQRPPRPRDRPRRRDAPRRQPPGRHPARMPENRTRVRRSHRMVPPCRDPGGRKGCVTAR